MSDVPFSGLTFSGTESDLLTQLDDLSDTEIGDYADNSIAYDPTTGLVSSDTVQGSGTTDYTNIPSGLPDGMNTWSNEQVEMQMVNGVPVLTTTTFYNFEGDVLLSDISGGGQDQVTYNVYDDNGNLTYAYQPSAVDGYSFDTASAPGLYPDFTGSGLVDVDAYYDSTTVTPDTSGAPSPSDAGGVAGDLQASGVQQGQYGTPDWQSSVDYIAESSPLLPGEGQGEGSATVYETCHSTQYQNDEISYYPPQPDPETDSDITTYTYTFNGLAIATETTTLPFVSTDQHGPGPGYQAASTDVYNSFGQVVWSKDADGSISYTAYDPATGAVVEQIQDVNTAITGDFTGLPAGWSSTTGKNLVTTYEVDSQGRTIEETDPDGNVTWTVYNDAVQTVSDSGGTATILSQTRTYPGWHYDSASGQWETTGPVQVSQEVVTAAGVDYTDSLTYGWTGSLPTTTLNGLTAPTGQEPLTSANVVVQSLSRSITNDLGQTISSLEYTSMPSSGYLESTAAFGTKGQNYLETDTIYDDPGRSVATVDAAGTMSCTVYDAFGRVTDQWTGTVSPANTYSDNQSIVSAFQTWLGSNSDPVYSATGVNLYQLSHSTCDADGNLIESDQYVDPTGVALPRATYYQYDWRDRQTGTVGPDGVATIGTLDNLGEATQTQTYASATYDSGAIVTSAANLRAQSESDYDSRGRVYESRTYFVAGPETLTGITFDGSTATAAGAFNREFKVGDVVQVSGATDPQYNGQFTITAVSGNTFSYAMSGTAGSASGTLVAACVQPGTYLPIDTWYDADGNVLATRTGSGPIQKWAYDGAGELIGWYTCADADPSLDYASVTSVATYDTVVEQTLASYYPAQDAVLTATYERLPGSAAAGALTTLDSYVTATIDWTDVAGRPIQSVNYGREDTGADPAWTHYIFDGTSGDLMMTGDVPTEVSYGAGYRQPGTTDYIVSDTIYDDTSSVGPIVETIDNAGIITQTQSDLAGRTLSTIQDYDPAGLENGLPVAGDTAEDITTAYQYDSGGRLASQTAYDANGSALVAETTQYLYQSSIDGGLETGVIYPETTANPLVAVQSLTQSDNTASIVVPGATFSAGDWICVSGADQSAFDGWVQLLTANAATNTYTFNMPVMAFVAAATGSIQVRPLGGDVTTADYDLTGAVTIASDQRGVTHLYSYDSAGRETEDTVTSFGPTGVPDAVDQTVVQIKTTYTDVGQVQSIETLTPGYAGYGGIIVLGTPVSMLVYAYDGWGNMTREVQITLPLSGFLSVQYTYDDGAGGSGVAQYVRPSSIEYPNGRQVDYDYAAGVDSVMSRLTDISDSTGVLAGYSYLGADTMASEDFQGPQIDLDYSAPATGGAANFAALDRFGRVLDQVWASYGSNAGTLDGYGYSYNSAGNRTSQANLVDTALSELYGYDDLNRLTSMARGELSGQTIPDPSKTQGWTVDALGNFSNFDDNGTSQDRTSDAANEIQTMDGAATPGYDLAGNMTRTPNPSDPAGGLTCSYDAWDRLVQVSNASGVLAKYEYDGLGRMVMELSDYAGSSPQAVTYYLYSGQNAIETRSATFSGSRPSAASTPVQYQYVFSPLSGKTPVVRDSSFDPQGNAIDAGRLYYLADANSNVTAVVGLSGCTWVVSERYVYDPYGTVTMYDVNWTCLGNDLAASPAHNTVAFASMVFDPVTRLYNDEARWYSTATSGFISRDPAQADENLYRYCGNEPTEATDPSGLDTTPTGGDGYYFGLGGNATDTNEPLVDNADMSGLCSVDASWTMTLPAAAGVVSQMPDVLAASYIGAWVVINDKKKGQDGGGGTRTWASLKYYEASEHSTGLQVAAPPLHTWTEDIFDGGAFPTDKTSFQDFPGLNTASVPKGEWISVQRSYCIMILCLKDSDKTQARPHPLATFTFSLDVSVGVAASYTLVHVWRGASYSWPSPPANWMQILHLTPWN